MAERLHGALLPLLADLIAHAEAGDLPATVAVRGTVYSEEADKCDLQPDFKAVIKQVSSSAKLVSCALSAAT